MKLPNFFIVGAAKSGTTSLWRYLLQHPDVFMPSEIMYKEPAYFSDIKGMGDLQQYGALFSGAGKEKMIGEASTAYLTSPESPVRIKQKIPEAKIIIILRNPIDRAYSLYNWMVCNGYEPLESFESALEAEKLNRYGNETFKRYNPEYYYNYLYFNSGLYSAQIKRYLDNYKKEQLCFLIFEEFKADTEKEIRKVYRFLNVDDKFLPNLRIHNKGSIPHSAQLQFYIRQKLSQYLRPPYDHPHPLKNDIVAKLMKLNTNPDKPEPMNKATRKRLKHLYSMDVIRTGEMIGTNLSQWWSDFNDQYLVMSGQDDICDAASYNSKTFDINQNQVNNKPVSNLLDQPVSLHDLMGQPDQIPCSRNSDKDQNCEPNTLRNSQNTSCRAYPKNEYYKVAHLCVQDFGGAGKAAYRLHKGLQTIGIDSKMLVMNKMSRDSSVKVLPTEYPGSPVSCLDRTVHISSTWKKQLNRWNFEWQKYPDRPSGLEAFTDVLSDIKLNQVLEIQEADIINLHWVAGLLDFPSAPLSLNGKKLIWTLHDMNPFTGGCHYAGNCEKYKENCGACPQLGSNHENDLSKQVWNQKRLAYKKLQLNIVTPSQWLCTIALESKLFSGVNATVIPNGFPTDIFKPFNKTNSRKRYNIPESARVILFGADSVINKRKGFQYLLKALDQYSSQSENETVILTFGQLPLRQQIKARYPVYNLGSIADENELAMAYSAADVFVIPSLEDNMPNTVVEAMACGVPVVGFDVGGIPDMIDHKKNGFLARPRDIRSLLEGIGWIISSADQGFDFLSICREKVQKKYDIQIQANNYKALYDSIIQDKQSSDMIENINPISSKNSTSRSHMDTYSEKNIEEKESTLSLTYNETDCNNNNASPEVIVSAIVSTFNAERFIQGCLEDLEAQTISDQLEIIVINSGSEQNEEKIIKEFQARYSNIKYIQTNHRETVYAAWNRGIQAATGKYITNANTDDRHRKDAFEVMVNALETNPEIALVYANLIITETENESLESHTPAGFFNWLDFNRDDLLNKGCFVGPQPMWRREVHEEYGYFDPSFVTSGDYEFWLRISQTNKFLHLPVQLGLYLRSPGSIEHSNRDKQREENHRILQRYRKAHAAGEIIGRIQDRKSSDDSGKRNDNMNSLEAVYKRILTEMGDRPLEEMIAKLEVLTDVYPEFAMAHNDLGVLHHQSGDKQKAQQCYEKATQLDPVSVVAKKNLADFYCLELGRIEDALKIYVSILALDPQDVETLMATAHICKAMEKFEDARDFFSQVLQIEPQHIVAREQLDLLEKWSSDAPKGPEPVEDIYRRFQEQLGTLSPQEAITELEAIIHSYPGFAVGHNDLAVFYYNSGDKQKALEHYRKAAHLQPNNITLQKNLADFLFVEEGRVAEALQIFVDILATHPDDVETLLITGHICVSLQQFEDAADYYRRVLVLDPDNHDAGQNLAAVLDRITESPVENPGSVSSSAASPARAETGDLGLERNVNQNAASEMKVSIVIRLDGIENRIKECLKSIQLHTAVPYELLLMDCVATKGMRKWARQLVAQNHDFHLISDKRQAGWSASVNRALAQASGDLIVLMHNDMVVPDGWLNAFVDGIQYELETGVAGPMFNRVKGIQQVMHTNEPDRTEFEANAAAFYEQSRYARVPVSKLSDLCLVFRRNLIEKIGSFDEQFTGAQVAAEDFCCRATAAGFRNWVAADTYVYHYDRHAGKIRNAPEEPAGAEDRKKYKEKWNNMQNAEAIDFQVVETISRAVGMSQNGRIDPAVKSLLGVIGAQPEDKRFYFALAQILLSAKRFEDAKEALKEMPSTNGSCDPQKLQLLGYAEEGLANYDAARSCAEQLLSINPEHASALNLKGILAYRNGDSDSAEACFMQAISADPGFGEPYTNLGMLRLEADCQMEALQFLEKGFRLAPADMDIANHYHSLVAETADYAEAENIVRQAAVLYPESQKIKYMLIDFLIQQGKYELAMPEIEDAIIRFGMDDGILAAALKIREKLGPMTLQESTRQAPVSVCMIIKNEEKYLARCLASLKPIVDEIIVVDTGSTDPSKEIATTFGARVFEYEWENDFAAARNYSISKAGGEWILVMDGDEVISPRDHEQFNQLVARRPKKPVAYTITTRNYNPLANIVGWVPNDGLYPDEEATIGWLPSEKVRLFYGKEQIRFEGAVHELVDPVLHRNKIEIKKCTIPVHHYGRLDQTRLDRKGEIYFEIGQKKLDEMGEDVNALRELAIQATILERNQEAIDLWQRLLAVNPIPELAAIAYVNMGTIYSRLNRFEDALAVGQKALECDPQLKEAQYNCAVAELHGGNAIAAVEILEKLLYRFPDYPPANFIQSAAYICADQKERGLDGFQNQKNTPMGVHLVVPCLELGQSLMAAQQNQYALAVLGGAIECDIVNKEILDLFAECLKMNQADGYPADNMYGDAVELLASQPGNLPQQGCAD